MLPKLSIPLILLVLVLASCGSPTTVAPITTAEATPAEGAYPYPPVISNPPPAFSNPYPLPGENPYAPTAGDDALRRGNATVHLNSSRVILAESAPVQVLVRLVGALPNPCYKLRVNVPPPDAQNRIYVEVYGLADPNQVCTEVLSPFDVQVSLGSYASGKYSVYINGELLDEFDI